MVQALAPLAKLEVAGTLSHALYALSVHVRGTAVQEAFRQARGDFRLDAVVKSIETHLAGGNHLGDMSILNIRLGN